MEFYNWLIAMLGGGGGIDPDISGGGASGGDR
jgi:hypothetical protein